MKMNFSIRMYVFEPRVLYSSLEYQFRTLKNCFFLLLFAMQKLFRFPQDPAHLLLLCEYAAEEHCCIWLVLSYFSSSSSFTCVEKIFQLKLHSLDYMYICAILLIPGRRFWHWYFLKMQKILNHPFKIFNARRNTF